MEAMNQLIHWRYFSLNFGGGKPVNGSHESFGASGDRGNPVTQRINRPGDVPSGYLEVQFSENQTKFGEIQ